MNIIKRSIFSPHIIRQHSRAFSYKTVTRPNLTDKPRKAIQHQQQQEQTPENAKSLRLSDHIAARIKFGGPITLAEYMREVLVNPNAGYYMNRDMFGHHGDFITSPEIGQIFGEMIAIWCLTEYQKLGSPSPLQIVELGPGRGTLMQDILRIVARFRLMKEFSIELVEISPFLSKAQSLMLCVDSKEVQDEPYYRIGETASGMKVRWYRSYDDVPDGFTILLAHEFFDALPVNKLLRDGEKWREMLVDIDVTKENAFRFVQSREETPISRVFSQICHTDETRDVVELCLESDRILRNVAKKLEEHGGFGLIMDYGHFGEKGDTFRAFKRHQLHDPLVDPGSADLTCDVDFRAMQKSCRTEDRLITFGPVAQGDFLKNMGADVRLESLLKNAENEEQRQTLRSGYDMLTAENQMGKRFKFFSMFPAVVEDHLKKFPVSGFS